MEINSNSNKKLRFAIMCNTMQLKQWQLDVIKRLAESGIAEPILIISNQANDKKISFGNKILHYPYRNLIWKRYQRKLSKLPMQLQQSIPENLRYLKTIDCTVVSKGFSEYFDITDIEEIKSYDLDFILRFGFNIIRGDILNSAKYGVWSFHHGDEQKYRGGPFGFWEVYKNDFVNGVILQRLTEKLDAGIILKKYYLKTTLHSYKEHVNNLLHDCIEMPLQVCRDIMNNNAGYFNEKPITTKAKIYKAPKNCSMIIFLFRVFFNRIKFHYQELFRSEKWFIGVSKKTAHEIIFEKENPEFDFIKPNRKWEFFADSFIYTENGSPIIIFEHFNYKTQKGIISSIPVYGANEPIQMLSNETHLAYPFIFREDENTYCIPEESYLNRIALYKLNKQNQVFELHQILFSNIDAVDTTMFKFNQLYWLFFTRKSTNTNTKLFAYYAENLVGPYTEHHNNPIKTDIRSARPAGTPFEHNGNLYRPAQNSAKHYGASISICKITELTPFEFSEELVSEICPQQFSKNLCGTHTISVSETHTVFDLKKHGFIFQSFKNQISRKFKKIGSK